MNALQAPFPYFGGKSSVAPEVWKRFGPDIKTYIEPFCGSMAMLLYRQEPVSNEVVNDIDGLLTNFWRAIRFDPEGVAALAEAPSSEIDLMARHNWVYTNKERIIRMQDDPSYYDVEAAAYWVYCRGTMAGPRGIFSEEIGSRIPKLGQPQGIHARKRRGQLKDLFGDLSKRLREVTIACGSWERVLTNAPTKLGGTPTAIFLDPHTKKGNTMRECTRISPRTFLRK